MKLYLFLGLSTILFLQCRPKKLNVHDPGPKLFEMEKSPCFGYCPVYHVTIYKNGLMQLDAKQNMNISGAYMRTLSKKELKSIKANLSSLSLHTFNDEYREPIADAPTTRVVYYGMNPEKKIYTNFQFPDSLQRFTDSINEMVLSEGWTISDDSRIKTEFILLLEDNASLSEILKKYTTSEMMLVKRLDPNTNQYWLVTAMIESGSQDAFLKKLVSDPAIKQAQLNKPLDQR